MTNMMLLPFFVKKSLPQIAQAVHAVARFARQPVPDFQVFRLLANRHVIQRDPRRIRPDDQTMRGAQFERRRQLV
jgi:hypothetical protein